MFPMMCIAMMIVMAIICLLFFTQDDFRPPWAHWIESHRSETALEIVEKRYARGEIDGEEFEQIRRALMSHDEAARDVRE
jgi:uncharacterized membrane protein